MTVDPRVRLRIDPVAVLALVLAVAAVLSVSRTFRLEGLVGHTDALRRCLPALALGCWSLRRTTRRRRRWRGLALAIVALLVALAPVMVAGLILALVGMLGALAQGMRAD
jgi:hypothetical protein